MTGRRRALAAALLGAAALAPATPAPAIVGGTRADPADHPYVVHVGVCTGSLIGADRVLTAGHCVEDGIGREGSRVTLAGGEVRRVVRVAEPPAFVRQFPGRRARGRQTHLDVAILELDRPANVAPIALASAAEVASGTTLVVAGYGANDASGSGQGVLREATVQARDDGFCATTLAKTGPADDYAAAVMLCTVDPDGRSPYRSPCYGDSGAPLVALPAGGPPAQVGVDDWGVSCGVDGDPEAYASAPAIAAFATSPAPTWRPLARTAPRLVGTAAVGRTLTCSAPAYESPPPDSLRYRFFAGGTALGAARAAPRLAVARRLRGHVVRCRVVASGPGGHTISRPSAGRLVL